MRYVPLLVLVSLFVFLTHALLREQKETPSPLLGQPFPSLMLQGRPVALPAPGKVMLVNVFASWCLPCAAEHPQLMELAKRVPILGIAWKNKPEQAEAFLRARGNPFVRLEFDERGDATLPLSLTGVPESFLLDARGVVMYHTREPITPKRLSGEIFPLLREHGL